MLRAKLLHKTTELLERFPVVALLGPRQAGKTTLAREIAAAHPGGVESRNYFDLENPNHLARLENPLLALQDLRGLVIIDEIQRRAELFPVLRVLVDRPERPARFLILGSASRDLLRQSSESLAGRIAYHEVTPFAVPEVGPAQAEKLWLRGGFPLSFLAGSDAASVEWREFLIRTYLEQDIPALGIQIPAPSLRRFWMMLVHAHGQVFNASELGRSLGVADTTVRRYLDILTGTFMLRRLSPWFENIAKRQVKSPKVYFRDSGILHALAGVAEIGQLHTWPRLGASWEGFALEETLRWFGATEENAYFWAVHGQGELDLLLFREGRRLGFEFKYADAPRVSAACHLALDCLRLDELILICPGEADYPLAPRIRVLGLQSLLASGPAGGPPH